MKKLFFALACAVAYATFLGMGLECLFNLLGLTMAISLDGAVVTKQYPRFIPFCILAGFVALAALVAIFIFNLKVSEKYSFTKKIWWMQMIIAVIISLPMIKAWEMLFEFLQKTF
ncbi:MAG: hypothetical protein E7589_02940 [Ruminococcaceae bacterium]|nr:hypothetical protein [Oscillospiraceae bacterium]